MNELKDDIEERYAGIFRSKRKKKPGEPADKLYKIYSPSLDLLLEKEEFEKKKKDWRSEFGLDDDPFPERKRRKEEFGLSRLGESVSSLSNYIIYDKPKDRLKDFGLIEKIPEIITEKKKYKKIHNSLENYFIFNKNKKEILNNYKIPKILTSKFSSIQTSPLGLNLTLKDDTTAINADNIGEFALPIVEYIHQIKPDYVIASDRGARLLGLAVFKLHGLLYGRFPTADGTIKFRRFSKSNPQEETEKHLQPMVKDMLEHKQRPTVLVLDDWVCSGGTKRIAEETFDRLSKGRIKTKFGVLIGTGGDISGHISHTSGFGGVTDWRDDSNIIGVKYGNDNWSTSGTKAKPVHSQEARDYRIRMYEGIQRFAKKLTS